MVSMHNPRTQTHNPNQKSAIRTVYSSSHCAGLMYGKASGGTMLSAMTGPKHAMIQTI
jgi:hypothetical protein